MMNKISSYKNQRIYQEDLTMKTYSEQKKKKKGINNAMALLKRKEIVFRAFEIEIFPLPSDDI